jgi:glycosyltransferase involved in cell wall biosynthesis
LINGYRKKILFIHQNFPGQFKHLAPALAAKGHTVAALTLRDLKKARWQGVTLYYYQIRRQAAKGVHPWVADTEAKVIRGQACFMACLELKKQGFDPDVIVAHPGWGESLFVKEVWPQARLGIYCEFYYRSKGQDMGFDPEFSRKDPGSACRLLMKNVNNLLHFETADAGLSPTHWQAGTFPERFRPKITVAHDGIDTALLAPRKNLTVALTPTVRVTRQDKVVTFINRNLEPYRGYHIFMRTLPDLLARHPDLRVIIIGADGVSYGSQPPKGMTWKEMFLNEVKDRLDMSRVHFTGRIPYDQYMAVMQVSTVHVYLTYPFVLSWSLLEAMSMGCCIVASDTKPLHEAIEHGKTGMLVDFFDVKGIADQVSDLLGNEAERLRLGENARRFAVETYDLTTVCLPKQVAWVEGMVGQ